MSRLRAIELRKEGKSLNEIVAILDKPKATIWGWVRSVVLTDDQKASLKNFGNNHSKIVAQRAATQAMVMKFEKRRNDDRERGRLFIRGLAPLPTDIVAAVMLYWAEGSKSKRSSFIFSNSDPSMIKFMFDCLIRYGMVDRDGVKVSLCFYDNLYSKEEVEAYWLNLLGLGHHSLYKSQINKRPQESAGRKIGKLPYGVCSLTIPAPSKRREMEGMIEEVKSVLGV